MTTANRPRSGVRRRIGRAILRALAAAGLTIGASRALEHGSGGDRNDALLDRFMVEQAPRGDESQGDGLLDRVPGWALLAGVAVLVVLALLWRFRY